MLLTAVPARVAQGQGGYSEKLNVYVSGSSAMWSFTFAGLNGSAKLSSFESTPGLSWYNVTAIKTTSMLSDMQIFGPDGYNLLPVPFTPSQGLFLTVGSDSYGDASASAKALDSYLLTSFVSLTNGTGTYAFYSPVSFKDLIPSTLFAFLPTKEAGFTNAIGSAAWLSSDAPFVDLSGQKGSSGFSHDFTIGSISTTAFNSSDQPNLLSLFGGSVPSLTASSHSTSSVVTFHFLDGLATSKDSATVTSDSKSFSSTYALSLSPGKSVSAINATVVQLPAPLLALRAVDTGVLRTNDDLAVTLTLKNLSPSDTITKVTFSDNWWDKTGDFKFLSGNYTVPAGSITPGLSVTPVYRLQYVGNGTGAVTIPASVVHYQYLVGGKVFNGTATLNPIRLSLGADDAVVMATVSPAGTVDQTVGSTQKFNITVTNVGTLPASSVVVAGHSIAGLAARSGGSPGGSATVTVSKTAVGLLGVNFTGSFLASYQDPGGTFLNATTNVVSNTFSHFAMAIGFPTLTWGASLATLPNSEVNLTLTFTVANGGSAAATSFRGTGTLPPALGCGRTNGTGISCSGGVITHTYPQLNKSASYTTTMKYNLTSPMNLVLPPMGFHAASAGINFTGKSNAVAVPAGLVLSKQFTPAQLFGGMTSQVKVFAINRGALPLYNATVGSTVDSFDTLSSSAVLTKSAATIGAGANATIGYGVTATETFGNLTGTPPTASFFFGGTTFTINGASPKVEVYQPLGVSISTYPTTPEEGKNFTITFQIKNPSGVSVSNVQFALPIPAGLGLSDVRNASIASGSLTISPGSLGPHGSATATASAVASSGITIPFDKATLTFSYAGTTINGIVPRSTGIAISEDITTRYLIPTAFILLVLLFTAVYIRRKAEPISPASPK